VQDLLEPLERTHPALVREVSRQIPVPVLAEVLRQLLEEGIAIRPLRTILEGLLDAPAAESTPRALVERCRRALRRHIAHGHAGSGVLDALLLDPAAESTLRQGLAGDGAPAVDPRMAHALFHALGEELASRVDGARPVLLTASDLRRPLRQLLAARYPRLAVLSYEELPASLPVRPVGALALPADAPGGAAARNSGA
jgi:type III secretion protein V